MTQVLRESSALPIAVTYHCPQAPLSLTSGSLLTQLRLQFSAQRTLVATSSLLTPTDFFFFLKCFVYV